MNITAGNTVELKRDIRRLPEWIWDLPGPWPPLTKGSWLPYASAGDVGVVLETFKGYEDGSFRVWHAKVRMDDGGVIKTFRLTSLCRTDTAR